MEDRELDAEGVPDLEGPLPEKAATGDPQGGVSPPADHPSSLDYGVTAAEQQAGEPLGLKLAREEPDVVTDDEDDFEFVDPEDEDVGLDDVEGELVGRVVDDDAVARSAEEAAMH